MEKVKQTVVDAVKSFWEDPIGVGFSAGSRVLVVSIGLYLMFCFGSCGAQILISAAK